MAGHRGGLVADAFHQAAVARDDIGVVVDKVAAMDGSHVVLGHRHADGIRQTLAERAGGRLDPAGVAGFGMAGCDGADLTEIAELVHRHVGIAGKVEKRVDQHRAVPGRQNEAVTVGPVRGGRVEFQMIGKQRRGCIGHSHRHAGVAGFGGLDGVH